MLCRWINDKEVGRIHIPGCMGAAVYGPGGCTCNAKRQRKQLEDRVMALEEKVRKLEQREASTR